MSDEYKWATIFWIGVLVLCILFWGDPDIADGIIAWLMG